MTGTNATVIIVAFRTTRLDLAWVPDSVPVFIVHNDKALDPLQVRHPAVVHLGQGANVGFGRAVNSALPYVSTSRVVLANPDMALTRHHWDALSRGGSHDLVVVPLIDSRGAATTTVNRYPTPLSLALTALRIGRLLSRGSRLRHYGVELLGQWGKEHARATQTMLADQDWPAATHWAAATACSYPTDLLRRVHGFDPSYFLYLEDVDLCARMSGFDPGLRILRRAVAPGMHAVSASSRSTSGRVRANLEQARSALLYASSRPGGHWRAARFVLRPLVWWRQRSCPQA